MPTPVQLSHPDLAHLEFAIRLYLHLAMSPQNDENVHLRDMPSLASETIDLRPGLHILRWPASEQGVWRGGAYLHAKFAPQLIDDEWKLVRSSGRPVFVAVEQQGGVFWYGELMLCFSAAYRPGLGRADDAKLCLIRWLQPVSVVARVEFAANPPKRASPQLTEAEKAGPFESYRWATSTGSFRNGHPRAGTPQTLVVEASRVRFRAPIEVGAAERPDDANPLFRLVTDMCGRF